ncbi:AAA-domain-containing protein [Hyaloraphidium curvatum]|nr:AAA-domain-containing protein [Hyaloraphidium curvatum]
MYARAGPAAGSPGPKPPSGDEGPDAVEIDGEAAPAADGPEEPAVGAADLIRHGPDPVAPAPARTSTPSPPGSGLPPASAPNSAPRREARRQREPGALPSAKSRANLAAKHPPPTTRLRDMGGIENLIPEILRVILLPFQHTEIHTHLGITPPRGVLLYGPPGCGKTLLANAIAGELGVPFINISGPSVVGGMSGESEKRIREIFDEAKELAPAILFFDEIDVMCPKRENATREMERRMVAQFLTCMDEMDPERTDGRPVIVLGATNRPDALDPALRRAGRFDREMALSIPDEAGRRRILGVLCSRMKLGGGVAPEVLLDRLAKITPGYVGADLVSLCSEAGSEAVGRIYRQVLGGEAAMDIDSSGAAAGDASGDLVEHFLRTHPEPLTEAELAPLAVTEEDFLKAVKKVQPSSKREGFATVPDISWDDIGALTAVREELRMSVVEPIRHPELFKSVGIVAPMGVLMYGPPGCGKTLLAKAVANESHSNFLSVKGPELLNKYVGESERAIRQVFLRARASAPCIIFFDELDALAPTRSGESDSQSTARLVNTLLTELDGMTSRGGVFVIAATNRPDMIDPAMLRPGRLDRVLYVDLPNAQERVEILRTVTRTTPLDAEVDLVQLASDPRCDGFSGADLAALVREAAMNALRSEFPDLAVTGEVHPAALSVCHRHFEAAFAKVGPSVSKKVRPDCARPSRWPTFSPLPTRIIASTRHFLAVWPGGRDSLRRRPKMKPPIRKQPLRRKCNIRAM